MSVTATTAPAAPRAVSAPSRHVPAPERQLMSEKDSRDAQFAEYMTARQPALLRIAYLLTGDTHTAEDLVQTALAKLYLNWEKVDRRDSLDGYVRRILVNEHNSLWRRPWKRRETNAEPLPEQVAPQQQGRDTDLWDFVQTLPRKQRAAVVLRYYEELSEAETADVLGVSVGTVKSQTSRALATMRARSAEISHLAEEDAR